LLKRIGFGCTLGVDPAGGTAYSVLGNIVDSIDGPEAKTVEVDTTLLGDKYKTSAGADVDPGNVTYEILMDPADTSYTTLSALLGNSNLGNWQVVMPPPPGATGSAISQTFLGYVAGMSRAIKKAEKLSAKVTVRVSGQPGY
jgi:hypothetical protein